MAFEALISQMKALSSDQVITKVLITVHQQVTTRAFDAGKDANNTDIGEYSDKYIKTRQKKGLGTSRKVVLEFSGQMRNDFLLKNQGSNVWTSGFSNEANFDKSEFVEETYKKEIFKLSNNEEKLIDELISNETKRILNG